MRASAAPALSTAATFLAMLASSVLLTALPAAAAGTPLARDRDPVVMTGADLSWLLGLPPSRVVAFRYENGWAQVPIQVDERAVVDFGTVYGTSPSGFTLLTYTDALTFTGPDPEPAFDADDELVLMGRDAGARATAAEPAAVVPGSGVELTITDPLSSAVGYAYLFESDGSLDPGAGVSLVDYDFVLESGEYLSTYNTQQGPNPEDSRVTTSAYSAHFSDRWIRDETAVTRGGASGADILDRHKALFAPGNCTRNEETFSNGEGAFIVNRQGPIRALRGYVGANSGPTTYRVHAYYEAREDILTALRVHPIPGIMDYFDYSPAASGMVYRNDLNPDGVTVDGNSDAVTPGEIRWEMVTGSQGTLVMTGLIDTDIPGFDHTSYYSDDITPPSTQCTGDSFEYGASGIWEDDWIPNTDPALGAFRVLRGRRIIAYDAPGQTAAFAAARADEATHPLAAAAAPYVPSTAVAGGAPALGPRLAVSPNPATGPLRISFVLPSAAPLTLRLYDVRGRLLATVVEGTWPAGAHELRWDASGLAPGVYFARAWIAGRPGAEARIVRLR